MPYPSSLISFVNKVQNVSRQTLKCTPYKTDAVKSSSIVVVDLPANAMVDLDTLIFHFTGQTTTSSGYATFPRHIESLISKVSVEIQGMSIGSCNHLSDLYNIFYNLTQGSDLESKRKLYQNGAAFTAAVTANQTAEKPFKIHNWLGFLGTAKPNILDLGCLGSCRLHIFLESTNVLVKSSDCAGPEYELNKLFFTIDAIDVSDGIYYQAKNSFLSGGGIIEIPFSNFYSSLFQCSTFTQSSRFSLNTGSLDYLLACFPKYRTIQEYDATQDTTAYFKYSAMSNDSNRLVDYSFSVNNVQLPQWKPSIDDAYDLLLNVMGTANSTDGGICSSIVDADTWKSNFWVSGVRLDLLTDEEDRYVTGINTQGTNSTIVFESSGIGSYDPGNLLLFAKCTSMLRVGANKSLELIL